MSDNVKLKEKFDSFKDFLNKKNVQIFIIIFLILALIILGAWIRSLPISGLKDVTTKDWTLGPDLDPFLYLRHANEIINNSVTEPDTMRYSPLGSENYITKSLIPWTIVWIYKISTIFGNDSITYAAIITPIILFSISIVGFFLFCFFLFKTLRSSKINSIIASALATFLYVVSPEILHRTVGGIPEIESLGLTWIWFAFLFIILAWNEKSTKKMILFSILAGIFTGIMSWSWGGYRYIYMVVTLTSLIIFLFKRENKLRNIVIFAGWLIPSIIFEFARVQNIKSVLFKISDTGFSLFVLFIFIIYLLIYKTNLKKILRLEKTKISEGIVSIVVSLVLIILFMLIFNPQFIINLIPMIIENLLYPFGRGRVGATIAENSSLYLTEVINTFGYLFWSFLIGTIILFYEATKEFKIRKRILLNASFLIFIAGTIFSKVSSSSLFNGDNFISRFVYIGGILIFTFVILREYILAHKEENHETLEHFNNLVPSFIFLLVFIFWIIVSMKGAIRLFFIISPLLMIVSCYLFVRSLEYSIKSKDEFKKIMFILLLIIVLVIIVQASITDTKSTIYGAKASVPSIYNQQWQKAMEWVRENTDQGSIFVHWWDYGYWVQTIGQRPTVTDGGHFIGYWDHLIGRYLLTTPNPLTAMSFMKTHDVSYLLIDSTDLGKYPAYSRIGGDKNFDRSGYMTTIVSDKSQIKETQNSIIRIYQGGVGIDEDIIYEENGTKTFLPGPTYNGVGDPSYKSFLAGVFLEISKDETNIYSKQAEGIFVYNGQQIKIPIRYVYYNHELIDFKKGIDAIFYVLPRLYQSQQGSMQMDNMGSGIYLSPKISQSLFAQLYLMNDYSKNYPNVKLVYSQDDFIIENIRQFGLNNEFVDYNGFRGPIKIWKIEENSTILKYEGFLRTSGNYAEFDNLTFVK